MKKLKFLGYKWPWIARGYKTSESGLTPGLCLASREVEGRAPETSNSTSAAHQCGAQGKLLNFKFLCCYMGQHLCQSIWRWLNELMEICIWSWPQHILSKKKKKKITSREKNGVTGNTVSKRQHLMQLGIYFKMLFWGHWGKLYNFLKNSCIYLSYFWLRWVSLALHGLPPAVVCGLLIVVASLVAEQGLSCSGFSSCSTPVH